MKLKTIEHLEAAGVTKAKAMENSAALKSHFELVEKYQGLMKGTTGDDAAAVQSGIDKAEAGVLPLLKALYPIQKKSAPAKPASVVKITKAAKPKTIKKVIPKTEKKEDLLTTYKRKAKVQNARLLTLQKDMKRLSA